MCALQSSNHNHSIVSTSKIFFLSVLGAFIIPSSSYKLLTVVITLGCWTLYFNSLMFCTYYPPLYFPTQPLPAAVLLCTLMLPSWEQVMFLSLCLLYFTYTIVSRVNYAVKSDQELYCLVTKWSSIIHTYQLFLFSHLSCQWTLKLIPWLGNCEKCLNKQCLLVNFNIV